MHHFNSPKQKIIVSALLRDENGQVLIIRSTHMPENINDDEYFCIPSWEVPFGINPKEKIIQELKNILEENIQIESINSTQSYLIENDMIHVVEIIYNAKATEKICNTADDCISINFIDEDEIDSYILSERLKVILRKQ